MNDSQINMAGNSPELYCLGASANGCQDAFFTDITGQIFTFNQFSAAVLKFIENHSKAIAHNTIIGINYNTPYTYFVAAMAILCMKKIPLLLSPKFSQNYIKDLQQQIPFNLCLNQDGWIPLTANSKLYPDSILETGIIALTSGSSSLPKGVHLPWSSMQASAIGNIDFFKMQKGDRSGLALPWHHLGGFMLCLRALLSRGHLLHIGAQAEAWKNIELDYLSLVPFQLQVWINENLSFPIPRKTILLGGSETPYPLYQRLLAKDYPLSLSYGMTECCSTISATVPGHLYPPGHLGLCLPGRKMRLNQANRICISGQTLLSGHFENGEFHAVSNYSFETADQGEICHSPEGIKYMGRTDQIIVCAGENISPQEILNQLQALPAALSDNFDFYILPLKSDKYGHVPALIVLPKSNANLYHIDQIKADIYDFLVGRLPHFKLPKSIEVFPRRPIFSGIKPSRQELEDLLFCRQHFFDFTTLGDVNKPAIICWHGFLGNSNDFLFLKDSCLLDHYHLVLLNLPGIEGRNFFLDDCHKVAQFITASWDCRGLIGYSMGGRVATAILDSLIQLGATSPHCLLISSSPGLEANKNQERKERLESDILLAQKLSACNFDALTFLEKWYGMDIFANLNKADNFKQLIQRRLKFFPANSSSILLYYSLAKMPCYQDLLCRPNLPLIYLVGELDQKYLEISRHLPPAISIHKAPGQGHALLEQDTNWIRQAIEQSFLAPKVGTS